MITFTGEFRIHFNRHQAAPLVWTIATDDWEIAVAQLEITSTVWSVYFPKSLPDDEDGHPSAWLATRGRLVIAAGGRALITPEDRRNQITKDLLR